ncbi:hypothetical protein E4U15_001271 [Claviceps sp. LM218 group G6]|nr:hypothetical protein E4U15_001271 [Claviceps sp. LM218 group G6]
MKLGAEINRIRISEMEDGGVEDDSDVGVEIVLGDVAPPLGHDVLEPASRPSSGGCARVDSVNKTKNPRYSFLKHTSVQIATILLRSSLTVCQLHIA